MKPILIVQMALKLVKHTHIHTYMHTHIHTYIHTQYIFIEKNEKGNQLEPRLSELVTDLI